MRVVPRRGRRRASTPARDAQGRLIASPGPAAKGREPRAREPEQNEPDQDTPGTDEPARGRVRRGGHGKDAPERGGTRRDGVGGHEAGTDEPGKGRARRKKAGRDEAGKDKPARGRSGKSRHGKDEPGEGGTRRGRAGKSGTGEGGVGMGTATPAEQPTGPTAESPAEPTAEPSAGGAGGSPEPTRPLPVPGESVPTGPLDRRAAERARRAAALRRAQEQRRARAGRGRNARARPRSALLALVITLGVLIAAVAVTGALIASSREGEEAVPLAAPLHVYPVTQVVSGACPAGTQGITGQTVSGPACYQLSSGIAIRRVTRVQVQTGKAAGTHDVAIDLASADRRAFGDLTRLTVGRTVAFVVRDQLVTAPRVDMPITDGKVVVTGRFSRSDADRLVRTLKGP